MVVESVTGRTEWISRPGLGLAGGQNSLAAGSARETATRTQGHAQVFEEQDGRRVSCPRASKDRIAAQPSRG